MQGIVSRAIVAGVAVLATLGVSACSPSAPLTIDGADSQTPPAGAPYCMVDRDGAAFTVAGPAGEPVSVDGKVRGNLALVTADDYGNEVAPDAAPYNGILYNVPRGKHVVVGEHECETT